MIVTMRIFDHHHHHPGGINISKSQKISYILSGQGKGGGGGEGKTSGIASAT